MEDATPPRRFQFGLGTMFILLAIVACAIAAARASNLIVGTGVGLTMSGYWRILRDERDYPGWLVAGVGIITILYGMPDIVE